MKQVHVNVVGNPTQHNTTWRGVLLRCLFRLQSEDFSTFCAFFSANGKRELEQSRASHTHVYTRTWCVSVLVVCFKNSVEQNNSICTTDTEAVPIKHLSPEVCLLSGFESYGSGSNFVLFQNQF